MEPKLLRTLVYVDSNQGRVALFDEAVCEKVK